MNKQQKKISTQNEFSDEIDKWVIDAIKSIGLDTARQVLNAPREMLIEKADLEEETVDNILNILRAEFESQVSANRYNDKRLFIKLLQYLFFSSRAKT